MGTREFHDGAKDGLEALEPSTRNRSGPFDDLLTAMRKTAFEGRRLGEAYEVLWAMIEDPDCFVVLTLAGAMTIAKMGKIISAMIDHGMVQGIVSTGALIAHGLSESVGIKHTIGIIHRCPMKSYSRRAIIGSTIRWRWSPTLITLSKSSPAR
jgi:Deoxyhypusine synthase